MDKFNITELVRPLLSFAYMSWAGIFLAVVWVSVFLVLILLLYKDTDTSLVPPETHESEDGTDDMLADGDDVGDIREFTLGSGVLPD